DVEDLSAQRQDRLAGAVARLLRGAAGGIALDHEKLEAFGGGVGAVGELSRKAQFFHRGLARDVLFLAAADALLSAFADEIQQLGRLAPVRCERARERV